MRRKRRIRSPHPGVVLKRRTLPSGAVSWRARYEDPDTGRETYATLDAAALPTHEARRLWAIQKAKTLAKRRMDLAAGAPALSAKPIVSAVGDYLAECRGRVRAGTLRTYTQGVEQFARWAEHSGVRTTAELTQARLASFHGYLEALPRKAIERGGRRGQRRATVRRRAPASVNAELRAVKTMLGRWRALGLAAQLSRDAIADALPALRVSYEQPAYLVPAKLEKLLDAALRHDADVYAETRVEHVGLRPRGTTPRYAPIAPFVAFLLLTGCRRGEALGLTWRDIDLDAKDEHGHVVGEIRLRAAQTKTHRARTIGLEVSPALRALLAAMKLHAGKGSEALHVFGGRDPYRPDLVESARERLVRTYGAPAFTWQVLRSTCATYLTNAPGIFGGATVFMSAKQLGHSVAVAERHYLGVHRGIPKDAHTLEAAMQIEGTVRDVRARSASPATRSARYAVTPMEGRKHQRAKQR